MDENAILDDLRKDLNLDDWWMELVSCNGTVADFKEAVALESIPRTEVNTARIIAEKFKNRLSYVEAKSTWYVWDGRIHTPCDGTGIVEKIVGIYYQSVTLALNFVRSYFESLAKMAENANGEITNKESDEAKKEVKTIMDRYDKGEWAKFKSHRDRLSTESGLLAVSRLLKRELDVPRDYYENDQRWFVTRNWVIDLDAIREGGWAVRKHDPSLPVTKFFDADYTGTPVDGTTWDMYLKRSVPSEEQRRYLQVVTGAAFMGESKLRCIPNLFGPPRSGKSVFIDTMYNLGSAGAGYSVTPDSRAITKVTGQNFEQDEFRGRRFIGISEPSHTEPIDDDFLKRYTGDSSITTRTLHSKSSPWGPTGLIFVASNKPLKINTRDKAIIDRVQMIQFPVHFKDPLEGGPEEETIIPNLEDLILEDRSAVLSWIIAGMRKFVNEHHRVLEPPQEVIAMRGDVVADASTAIRWMNDFVEEGYLKVDFSQPEKYYISVKDAYSRYKFWCEMSGERRPLTLKFFTEDLVNRFSMDLVKSDGEKKFPGLAVTAEYRRKFEANGIPTF